MPCLSETTLNICQRWRRRKISDARWVAPETKSEHTSRGVLLALGNVNRSTPEPSLVPTSTIRDWRKCGKSATRKDRYRQGSVRSTPSVKTITIYHMGRGIQSVPRQDRHVQQSFSDSHCRTLNADYCHRYHGAPLKLEERQSNTSILFGDDSMYLHYSWSLTHCCNKILRLHSNMVNMDLLCHAVKWSGTEQIERS